MKPDPNNINACHEFELVADTEYWCELYRICNPTHLSGDPVTFEGMVNVGKATSVQRYEAYHRTTNNTTPKL